LGIFALGIILCIWSVVDFAKPTQNGLNRSGSYRISRNPMYIAYFVYFLGCVLLTRSVLLFAILLVFQISAHWIIRSEERWCLQEFGQEYIDYMKKVRRYI
jgi:protein-S-isoprenylcysteine O-methyltransferase Ste14